MRIFGQKLNLHTLYFYLLCKGFGPVGTTLISSKVMFLFLLELENKVLTASSDDDDDDIFDELFFLLEPSTGDKKVVFGTASDRPIDPKIRRDNAITRTANTLIASTLLSTSKKVLEQNLKEQGILYLKSDQKERNGEEAKGMEIVLRERGHEKNGRAAAYREKVRGDTETLTIYGTLDLQVKKSFDISTSL